MTAEQCAKVSAGGRQTMRAVASHSLAEGVARGSMAGEGGLFFVDSIKCSACCMQSLAVMALIPLLEKLFSIFLCVSVLSSESVHHRLLSI